MPPSLLFPKPKPNTLITVPSCKPCNKSFQKDDEYLRHILTSELRTANNAAAKQVNQSFFRSLKRPEAKGLKMSMLRSFLDVSVVTPAGINLGKAGIFKIDKVRVEKAIEHTIKGLFYHEKGQRLSDNCIFRVYQGYWDNLDEKIKAIISIISQQNSIEVGRRDVFQYKVAFDPENPNNSWWLLLFYEKIIYLCITFEPNLTG